MMKILINNETKEFSEPLALDQLVHRLTHLEQKTFAIAVNETFVPKTQYTTTEIQPGDRIEILSPMQGG